MNASKSFDIQEKVHFGWHLFVMHYVRCYVKRKIKNKDSVLNHDKFESFPTISILFAENTANDICKLNDNVTKSS